MLQRVETSEMNLTKTQKKRLREIVEECYLDALDDALAILYEDFQKWGGGQINAFELDERIHYYHQNTARELFNMFNGGDVVLGIIFALRTGTISIEALDSDLQPLFDNVCTADV